MGDAMSSATQQTTGGQQQSQKATVKCSKCSADIPQGTKFCNNCGNAIDALICPICKEINHIDNLCNS